MEKVKTLNKKEKILSIISTTKAKYIIGTILLCGVGITLPRIFHIAFGSNAGATFLPMHIAVLIAALTFGMTSSLVVAGSSIIMSHLLTNMPAITRLPYMLIELVIYGIILALFSKKTNAYISLIATIILGRILYAGVLFAATNLGFPTYGTTVWKSAKIGIPGLIIQLIVVPVIAKVMNERLNLKND